MAKKYAARITEPIGCLSIVDEFTGQASAFSHVQLTPSTTEGKAFLVATDPSAMGIVRCDSDAKEQCLLNGDQLRLAGEFNLHETPSPTFPKTHGPLARAVERAAVGVVTLDVRKLMRLARALGARDGIVTLLIDRDHTKNVQPIKVITKTDAIGLLMPFAPRPFDGDPEERWLSRAGEYLEACYQANPEDRPAPVPDTPPQAFGEGL